MSELSTPAIERARKAFTAVLQEMQEPGTQRNLAQAMGISETTVSRIKTDKLEDAVLMLYQLGFKVVPQHMKCYPEKYVEALHTMARMQLSEAPKLEWGDA